MDKTTVLQRGCRNLLVLLLGACICMVPTRCHLAYTARGILDRHTPDLPGDRGVV